MNTGSLYDWLKALHIIAIVAWMAALLYLPRLYVYHAGVPAGSSESALLKVMERRLLRAIMNPAMIATWVLGLTLALQGGWFRSGWLHAKLALVLALSGYHGYLSGARRRFESDANTKTVRFYRILNEVPTVLLILIVLLVVLKPF